jgi:hypothetical protein
VELATLDDELDGLMPRRSVTAIVVPATPRILATAPSTRAARGGIGAVT